MPWGRRMPKVVDMMGSDSLQRSEFWRLTCLVAGALACTGSICNADSANRQIRILPSTIQLSSPESRQTLIAQGQSGDQLQQQAQKVVLQSSDENIVRIEDGQALPVAN